MRSAEQSAGKPVNDRPRTGAPSSRLTGEDLRRNRTHRFDGLLGLGGPLRNVQAGDTEEAITERTGEGPPNRFRRLGQAPLGLVSGQKPDILRRQDSPGEAVVGPQKLRTAVGVGVGELELDPRGLHGCGGIDVHALRGCQALFRRRLGIIEVCACQAERLIDLDQPPIRVGIVGPGAVPDRAQQIGEAQQTGDGGSVRRSLACTRVICTL
jgi:hypothetical protein